MTAKIQGHRDDVNAVAWLDDSANLMISGSDDRMVKVAQLSVSGRPSRAELPTRTVGRTAPALPSEHPMRQPVTGVGSLSANFRDPMVPGGPTVPGGS